MTPTRFQLLLLRAYPRAFREGHRGDLLAFWQAQAGEPRYQGTLGRGRYTLHLLKDAVGGGLTTRWREGRGGTRNDASPYGPVWRSTCGMPDAPCSGLRYSPP